VDLEFAPVHAVELVQRNHGNSGVRMSDRPITKADLDAVLATLATRQELRELEARLRGDFVSLEARLRAELVTQVRSIEETFKTHFGALDDKLRAVHDRVRTDLDAHVANARVHVTTAPRRVRRARAKRR
jgi:hypothetical protein